MVDLKSVMELIDRWYYQDISEVMMIVQAGLSCYNNRFTTGGQKKSTGKTSENRQRTHIEQSHSLKESSSDFFVPPSIEPFTKSEWTNRVATATSRWMNEFRSARRQKDGLFLKMVELKQDHVNTPNNDIEFAAPTRKRFVSPLLEVVEEKEDSSRVPSPAESVDLLTFCSSSHSSRASSPYDDSYSFSSPVPEDRKSSGSTPSETVSVKTLSLESFDNPCSSDFEDENEDPELDEHESLLILLARPWWRKNPSPCNFTAENFKATDISEGGSTSIMPEPFSPERLNTSLPFYQTTKLSASTSPVDSSVLRELDIILPNFEYLANQRVLLDAIKTARFGAALAEQPEMKHEATREAETKNGKLEEVENLAVIDFEELNTRPCKIPDYLADMQPGPSGLRAIELRALELQEKENEKRRKQEVRAMEQAGRNFPELWVPQIYKFIKEKMNDSDLSNFRNALKHCGMKVASQV